MVRIFKVKDRSNRAKLNVLNKLADYPEDMNLFKKKYKGLF